ncbi:MAG: tetratricopeptide repeat protein [Nitrospirota bacterium]
MSDKASIIKEAQKYLARGQIDKAIAEWEKLAKENPEGNTFNMIGDLYLKKGGRTDAIDSYHRAAVLFQQEGFSLKALALYKKILNFNPSDSTALYVLGELNEAKGLTTDAIKFYLASADSLAKEGKKEKLLEVYAKIVDISPSNIPLRSKIAEIYTKEGLAAEAAKEFFQIARLYSEKGESEKAIEFFLRGLNNQPVNREAILDLNELYEKTGKLNLAIEQMKEAASLFPEDTEILLRSAEIHIMVQRFQDAREYLRQVTGYEPGNIRARRLLGDVYIKEGNKELAWAEYHSVLDEMLLEENYDDAIRLLETFKDIDPVETGKRLVSLYIQIGDFLKVIEELTSLGDLYISNGKQREALNCFREALKMNPDDDHLKERVIELEKEVGKEHIVIGAEKTIEEVIIEADIYLRYGLYDNARELLEAFVQKEPENSDLHLRLKSLHVDTGDREQAVSECLILHELYKKQGESASSEQIIREAIEINPDDPRLAAFAGAAAPEEGAAVLPEAPSIEDYSEELSEADFYARQGLTDEAREVLERLQSMFPEHEEINRRLGLLGQIGETEEKIEFDQGIEKEPLLAEGEALEVEEISEPPLDSDVMDIFNEFKKGLEKELEDEDFETHYNLGIAYKEMGLIDDAIREFQTSRKDPKRFLHSSNMLGICYIEKGVCPLAIDVLKDAIAKMEDRGESYWAMKYDLAEAYEKNGNLKESLDLYTEIYGWNSKFRAVSDKITQLQPRIADGTDQKKTKERKDRVSYL